MNTNSSTNQNDNENILMVKATITHFIKKISAWNTAQNLASQSFTLQPNKALHKPIYKINTYKRSNRHKTLCRIDNKKALQPLIYRLSYKSTQSLKKQNPMIITSPTDLIAYDDIVEISIEGKWVDYATIKTVQDKKDSFKLVKDKSYRIMRNRRTILEIA